MSDLAATNCGGGCGWAPCCIYSFSFLSVPLLSRKYSIVSSFSRWVFTESKCSFHLLCYPAEWDNRFNIYVMLPDDLFHPTHVIPAVELITTSVKSSHHGISHMLMKLSAVVIKVLVFLFCRAYAGVKVRNMLAL